MSVTGTSIIAGHPAAGQQGSLRANNPATNESLDPQIQFANTSDIAAAAQAAQTAFDAYRATSSEKRASFLEAIARNLEAIGDEIVHRAIAESALERERLTIELARTTNQLRSFATELRLGEHQGIRIDRAHETGRPDLRQRQIALGPVLVFGASNFPLAFSTAGGDTASALAAGCPVVVKAHNAHPGTAELAGQAITAAVVECELPAGTFSLLFGQGNWIGQELAARPEIKAIAFTGSQSGGIALMQAAASRPEPIPVFAEMSSINPVIVLPERLNEGSEDLANGFVGSLTLGAGQFCTNPGLMFVPEEAEDFVSVIAGFVDEQPGQTMLTTQIHSAYLDGVRRLGGLAVTHVAEGTTGNGSNAPPPEVFSCSAEMFIQQHELQKEVFGAAAVLVTYSSRTELIAALEELQGQLTATIHMAAADRLFAQELLPILERKVGRIVVNGWPTGVAVTDAMVHGGPFPATSDSRTTSVGSLAINRFQRPVCYQNFPAGLLPSALNDEGNLLPRRVDGKLLRS